MNAPESTEESECCVRVAVRIRPQNSREKIDLCRICTAVTAQEPQIVLGLDKAFTYDYVFDVNSKQEEIYTACIGKLVEGALKGYNGTVLAYGQTGSGKTYTMGTGFECDPNDHQIGIIPRAINHIFAGINDIEQKWKETYNGYSSQFMIQFSVAVQFIELYNEDIIDLLDPYNKVRSFKIVENGNHEISITGATIKPVQCPVDALKYLQQGALARTTASTKMNDQSSRSHALFTVLIKRQQILPGNDLETLTSKFNFVDLAGSERLKRTGATGERAREGISINCGLLALGNCISALGDISKKATHVPYRDSKLTRLLQDSLGGNSQTMMIACISPSDRDFMETLNTLKYANRARNIKNKIQINQDQNSRTICQLRREIAALQLEILDYKQGKKNTDSEGNALVSDTFYENVLLLAENKRLQGRLKSLQETVNILTEKNIQLKIEKEVQGWTSTDNMEPSITNLVAGYLTEIEHLQSKLIESEGMYKHLKKSCAQPATPRCNCKLDSDYTNPVDLINMAKLEIEKDREIIGNKSMAENTIELNDKDEVNLEDSDTELDQKAQEIENDLNNINSDIEIKTRLIEQLELSQQRIEIMRQHYEEKLNLLSIKILNTEKERDEVLSNLVSKQGNNTNDNVKKVREDYERKISDMQRELRRLQQAQKEHARQQREMDMQNMKIRKLRADLDELKCIKTRLMRKIADQTSRHKEEESRRVREIAKLRKEQRRSLNIVKSLQAKMLAKEQILKRKTEEVTALRKSQHGHLSRKAAGRTPAKDVKITLFNKEAARQRFDEIFKSIKWVARNKQLLMQFEKELEKLVNDRDNLSQHLAYIRNQQDSTKCIDLINEEDSIKSNLKYVHENIALVQQSIMECEDGKDTQNSSDIQSFQELLNNIQNIEESKYLLEHLIDCVVSLSCSFSLMENRVQEQVALLKEAQQETAIQQQILQHLLVHNNAINITDLMYSLNTCPDLNFCRNRFSSNTSLHSNETYDLPPNEGNFLAFSKISSRSSSPGPTVDLSVENNSKIRRRTAKAQDLLFGNTNQNIVSCSYVQDVNNRSMVPLVRVPSAPGSLK